jgi:hypothetical protein
MTSWASPKLAAGKKRGRGDAKRYNRTGKVCYLRQAAYRLLRYTSGERGERFWIEVLGQPVPATNTDDGKRAVGGRNPIDPIAFGVTWATSSVKMLWANPPEAAMT